MQTETVRDSVYVSPLYAVPRILGHYSKTGATVSWESRIYGLAPDDGGIRAGRVVVWAGPEEDPLKKPIYRQRDPYFQAAFAIHPGDRVVIVEMATMPTSKWRLTFGVVDSIEKHPCPGRANFTVWNWRQDDIEEVNGVAFCPVCQTQLMLTHNSKGVPQWTHPDAGWIYPDKKKKPSEKPCIVLSTVSSGWVRVDNTDELLREFTHSSLIPATTAALHKWTDPLDVPVKPKYIQKGKT